MLLHFHAVLIYNWTFPSIFKTNTKYYKKNNQCTSNKFEYWFHWRENTVKNALNIIKIIGTTTRSLVKIQIKPLFWYYYTCYTWYNIYVTHRYNLYYLESLNEYKTFSRFKCLKVGVIDSKNMLNYKHFLPARMITAIIITIIIEGPKVSL